jgi:hypothetical protein
MKTSKQHFLSIAQDYNPKNDPWGYAMGAAFDIAAEAYNRSLPNVLGYKPSPVSGAVIEDEYNAEYLAALSDNEVEKLTKFADKILEMLKKHGRDY